MDQSWLEYSTGILDFLSLNILCSEYSDFEDLIFLKFSYFFLSIRRTQFALALRTSAVRFWFGQP